MINTLLLSGIEIKQARKTFSVGRSIFPENTFIISLAQPKMGLIRNLLGQTFYPDNEWTRGDDGYPLRPYDLATHTMNEFMGVNVYPINTDVKGDFKILKRKIQVFGKVKPSKYGYVLDGRLNNSFKAVNLLLNKGIKVRRVNNPTTDLNTGDFVIPRGREPDLSEIAKQTGVDFNDLKNNINKGIHRVKRLRVGMYQRFYGGNMDEGWTRFLLEQFAFPYSSLKDVDIKRKDLNKRYDIIILPHDREGMIVGKIPESYRRYFSITPPAFRSGIGEGGVKSLKIFVENGGTLVALGDACKFAINKFELKVRNAVAEKSANEFFCPGSTLWATFNNSHPLAYGMPDEGLVLFWFSPAFEIIPGHYNERYESIVRYREKNLLQSGWLIGEEHVSNKVAMVVARYGKGQVILFGFRPQHRYQTHGTFKLLFNALIH